jgi:hypothetical protein
MNCTKYMDELRRSGRIGRSCSIRALQEKTRTGFYLGINKVDSIDGNLLLTTLVPPASPVGQFI